MVVQFKIPAIQIPVIFHASCIHTRQNTPPPDQFKAVFGLVNIHITTIVQVSSRHVIQHMGSLHYLFPLQCPTVSLLSSATDADETQILILQPTAITHASRPPDTRAERSPWLHPHLVGPSIHLSFPFHLPPAALSPQTAKPDSKALAGF